MTDDRHSPGAALARADRRSPSRTLTPLEGGILGLLARDGELSGWDIFKRAGRSVAFFVPIGRSQIYAALPRLEGRGLVAGRDVEQRNRPRKRVFTLTEAGHAQLHSWLAAGDPAATRDVFLLKVFFGAHTDPSAIRARVLQRRSDARLIAAEMEARPDPAELAFSDLDDFFHRLTREWARGWAELAEAWCDQALQALDALEKQAGDR
jgi:DNA-binding PadR family transcriptional regulator